MEGTKFLILQTVTRTSTGQENFVPAVVCFAPIIARVGESPPKFKKNVRKGTRESFLATTKMLSTLKRPVVVKELLEFSYFCKSVAELLPRTEP